ncbi:MULTISPECIES: hypothetical protein [Halomonadaceae]|uniref:hypothetical protein n=1 Tax=Halomonadaceae TaxID=28256 RepID=UPI00159819F4|nr:MULTISPECIES: hypothetical protein [Halomonas]QJQ96575.1 hypothetical protein HIO72_15730 [Halomonas sp. PA5]
MPIGFDQAAGLREWAEAQPRIVEAKQAEPARTVQAVSTLMVVGLPETSTIQTRQVERVLDEWRGAGQRWLGESGSWRVVPIESNSPHVAVLAQQQPRWALWVGDDPDAFRRAYLVLKQLHLNQGPRSLLALPSKRVARSGLLNNLQQAAQGYLGTRLLVLDLA